MVPRAVGGEKDEGCGHLFQEALLTKHEKMGHSERGSLGQRRYL